MGTTLQRLVMLASVPVGVAVGLWMALLTTHRYACPGPGLGLRNLCLPEPAFARGTCVLCGATAAAMVLLISLLIRPATSD